MRNPLIDCVISTDKNLEIMQLPSIGRVEATFRGLQFHIAVCSFNHGSQLVFLKLFPNFNINWKIWASSRVNDPIHQGYEMELYLKLLWVGPGKVA